MELSALKEIASERPFFETVNEREMLLGVVGAIVLRQISLSKAAEIMGMGKEAFLSCLMPRGSEVLANDHAKRGDFITY
jgi:predicted HTH domain antitoxin